MASSPSNRRVRALPVAVVALGLAITAVAGSATRHHVSVLRRQRFEARVVEARTEIDREVTSYAETLYGLRSLFAVEADVSRAAFHDYLTQSEIVITLDLNMGEDSATFWTCDYSYDYIKINAEYHT